MAISTLEELKAALQALQRRASLIDAVSLMRESELISDVEEAQLKIRLRAQLRDELLKMQAGEAE